MEKYFVIHNSEGDTTVEPITKEELLKRLDPSDPYYGKAGFIGELRDSDTNYWGNDVLIIKGEIVTPSPVIIVQQYDIK